jgi:hypothetical protein
MSDVDVLFRTYPARISAVEALLEAAKPRSAQADALRRTADALDEAGPLYGRASTAAVYSAFAELMRIAAMLVDWRESTLTAGVDAQRFLISAHERHKLWCTEYANMAAVSGLVSASEPIASVTSIDEIGNICENLARLPLPVGVFADEIPSYQQATSKEDEAEAPKPAELAVAFIRFSADGAPADELHFLAPNVMHDLDVEIRVSYWPDGAAVLRLYPVSIEPRSSYELSTFEFPRPSGEPPYYLSQKGRALLKVPQALHASPYEFRYAAAFDIEPAEPAIVVGQRNLRFESYDPTLAPMTGYRDIDEKLMRIRDQLRKSLVAPEDVKNTLLVLKCLGNLAGRALQDALLKEATKEKDFQTQGRDELRRAPYIGEELEEHPASSGGITDLSFRRIRIELKYDDAAPLEVKDCVRFLGQTAMYATGSGKRVGVLCVLDNSAKPNGPFPAADGIELLQHPVQTGSVLVATVLIQGNLPLPSALSR